MGKKLGILVVVWGVSVAFWALLHSWSGRADISLDTYGAWTWPLVFLVVFAAVIALALMLLPDRSWRGAAIALTTVPFLIAFGFSPLFLIAAVVFVAAQAYAAYSVQHEIEQRITIEVKPIARVAVRVIMTALILVVAVVFYRGAYVQEQTTAGEVPSQVANIVRKTSLVILAPELDQLTAAQRQQAEQQFLSQVTQQVTRFLNPFTQYLPEGFAIALFLVLQGVNFIFVALALWLVMGIFLILRATKFVRLEEYETTAQRPVL